MHNGEENDKLTEDALHVALGLLGDLALSDDGLDRLPHSVALRGGRVTRGSVRVHPRRGRALLAVATVVIAASCSLAISAGLAVTSNRSFASGLDQLLNSTAQLHTLTSHARRAGGGVALSGYITFSFTLREAV